MSAAPSIHIAARPSRTVARRFSPALTSLRLHLCSLDEPEEVREQHVAALAGWTTSTVVDSSGRLRIEFDYPASAQWFVEALDTLDAQVVELNGDRGVVAVRNPRTVLGRYGLRHGRWMFKPGPAAALGIARGAIHAAGLRIECPTPAMMLTLVAVLTRLDIKSRLYDGIPRVMIGGPDVAGALVRLGLDKPAEHYQGLRVDPSIRREAKA